LDSALIRIAAVTEHRLIATDLPDHKTPHTRESEDANCRDDPAAVASPNPQLT